MTHQQQEFNLTPDNPLSALLQNGPVQQRCIQRVAQYLPEIKQARALGYTWNTIADELSMRRPTLMNAFRILLERTGTHPAEAIDNTTLRPLVAMPLATTRALNRKKEASASAKTDDIRTASRPSEITVLAPGIVSLGRASVEKFNL